MVFEKVKNLILEELDVDAVDVVLEANLEDDLGADSIDAVSLIMNIEDEFDIQLDDEVAQNIKTVGDLVKFIKQKL